MEVLHDIVGLFLRYVFPAEVELPPQENVELKGIDEPDEGHKECVHEEENSFLLYNPIKMRVKVLETDGLHRQSHQGSREKHAHRVLEREGRLQLRLSVVFLQVREVVKRETHAELVEADDKYDQQVDQENSHAYILVVA